MLTREQILAKLAEASALGLLSYEFKDPKAVIRRLAETCLALMDADAANKATALSLYAEIDRLKARAIELEHHLRGYLADANNAAIEANKIEYELGPLFYRTQHPDREEGITVAYAGAGPGRCACGKQEIPDAVACLSISGWSHYRPEENNACHENDRDREAQ